MQLTTNQAFGAFAYETQTEVIIKKASLRGLTAKAINSGEEILAAIVNTANENFEGFLTDENEFFVTDENNNKISYNNQALYNSLILIYYNKYFISGKIRNTFEYQEFTLIENL